MHIIYEYFRESRTSSGYNKIRIKPEKYKSGFTANAKRNFVLFFVITAIKKFGSGPQFWRVGWPTANKPIFIFGLIKPNLFTNKLTDLFTFLQIFALDNAGSLLFLHYRH